jgi:hypothetical protein
MGATGCGIGADAGGWTAGTMLVPYTLTSPAATVADRSATLEPAGDPSDETSL